VVIDENPASIKMTGWFAAGRLRQRLDGSPGHLPEQGRRFILADGHSEIRKWRDKVVLGYPKLSGTSDKSVSMISAAPGTYTARTEPCCIHSHHLELFLLQARPNGGLFVSRQGHRNPSRPRFRS
jgi:hypothetical protein